VVAQAADGQLGAGWVMWLLIALSVLSVAIMLEQRSCFSGPLRDDIGKLARELRNYSEPTTWKRNASAWSLAERGSGSGTRGLMEADQGAKSPKRP